jgi:hypothetical protein
MQGLLRLEGYRSKAARIGINQYRFSRPLVVRAGVVGTMQISIIARGPERLQ